jgi:hypothetical protein
MFTHLWIKIILFELLLKFISLEILAEKNDTDTQDTQEEKPPITVSHNIIDQENVYGAQPKISNCFIDFTQYKMYIIDKDRIFHKEGEVVFDLFWNKNNNIEFKCHEGDDFRIKCSKIEITEHKAISFDYARKLSEISGAFSYLLILYGIFSLTKGYIYFNLTIIFYGSFGFILFVKELFEQLELNEKLNNEDPKSGILLEFIFWGSLIISILYGFTCFLSKYLKYITFGFINGIFFSKIIFFYLLILSALPKDLHTTYFLIELITVLIMIVFLIIVQNKSPIISITYVVLMATYGMIYGCNLLFGGVRFLPFLILAKDHESEKALTQVSKYWFHFVYLIAFILIVIIGIYKNRENYNIIMNRVKPK